MNQVAQNRKIGKWNDLKVLEAMNVFFENKIHSLLYDVYKMHEQFPGKLVTCICYENYVHRTKSDCTEHMECSVGILLKYHCYSKMYKYVGPSEVISSKQRKTK
jgi:hypothetical protein